MNTEETAVVNTEAKAVKHVDFKEKLTISFEAFSKQHWPLLAREVKEYILAPLWPSKRMANNPEVPDKCLNGVRPHGVVRVGLPRGQAY